MFADTKMKLTLPTCVVLLLTLTVSATSATLSPLLMATRAAESEKTGCYIVVLKEDTILERFQNIISEVVPMSMDTKLHGSVQRIAKAFTVKLSDHALNIVSFCNIIMTLSLLFMALDAFFV